MKPFAQYLMESQRTYSWRIRIAGEMNSEALDRLNVVLEAYKVESISKPKRLPIQESPEFPNFGPVEINIIDVVLAYPCNDAQLRSRVAEGCCIDLASVKVNPANHPYEAALEGLEQSNLQKPGESVLATNEMTTASPDKTLVGDARVPFLMKELEETRKYQYSKVAGGEEKDKTFQSQGTTNELPMGRVSPIGTHQNKIPVAKKMPAGNGR